MMQREIKGELTLFYLHCHIILSSGVFGEIWQSTQVKVSLRLCQDPMQGFMLKLALVGLLVTLSGKFKGHTEMSQKLFAS